MASPRPHKPSRKVIHAKKSSAQLDREIASALASRRHRSRQHSTLSKGFAAIPGIVVR